MFHLLLLLRNLFFHFLCFLMSVLLRCFVTLGLRSSANFSHEHPRQQSSLTSQKGQLPGLILQSPAHHHRVRSPRGYANPELLLPLQTPEFLAQMAPSLPFNIYMGLFPWFRCLRAFCSSMLSPYHTERWRPRPQAGAPESALAIILDCRHWLETCLPPPV